MHVLCHNTHICRFLPLNKFQVGQYLTICIEILAFYFLKMYWSIVVYNVVLVSGGQQSDSVIHIHIFIFF